MDFIRDFNPVANTLTPEDIEEAIKGCNFKKGLGPDWFDGSCLKDDKIRANLVQNILRMTQEKDLPKFLSEGRLVLFSKDKESMAQVDNTRPIVVLSHITKIIEKAIMIRLKKLGS